MMLGSQAAVWDRRLDHTEHSPGRRLHRLVVPEREILRAVLSHVKLDDLDEAHHIYQEAQKGNKVAQFIVGMALRKVGREDAAEIWFGLSAEQGFEPAIQHLRKAG